MALIWHGLPVRSFWRTVVSAWVPGLALIGGVLSHAVAAEPAKFDSANHLMRGSPPSPAALVDLANWQRAPFNVWGLRHIERLMPVASVDRGIGPETQFGPLWLDLARFAVTAEDGRLLELDAVLAELQVDALLVWHGATLRLERYRNGQTARSRHALLTATSAVTGLLGEMLVDAKVFDDQRLVPFYLPELKGSAWNDVSVREVMDMEVGLDFREIPGDPWSDYSQLLYAGGMARPPENLRTHDSLARLMPTVRHRGESGMLYQPASINVEVLGWLMHRVTGRSVAQLFGEKIFGGLGADRDALFATDPNGMSVASSGLALTARDLLRMGVMLVQRGQYNGQQIVEPGVVARLEAGGERRHGIAGDQSAPFYSYRAHWHTHHPTRTYGAWGAQGQYLFIAPDQQIVVVLQSSAADADAGHGRLVEALFFALLDYLGRAG